MKIISSILLALCVFAAVVSAVRPLNNLVGGYSPVSTSDPDVQAAASFAWQAVAAKDSRVNLDDASDLTVVTAAKQVVNGINFKLTLKGDFDGSEIDVNAVVYKDLDSNMKLASYRVTAALKKMDVGGYQPVLSSDPEVQAAASFVWEQVAAKDSRVVLDQATDLEIMTAFEQIVEGKNFMLELSGSFSGKQITVNAVVLQSLAGDLSLTSYDIDVPSDSVSANAGGYRPVSTSDPQVQAAASFTWEKVSAEDSRVNLDEGTDLEIVSAEQQIVNGKNYKLKLAGTFSGDKLTVDAVVYQTTGGDLSLTSYSVESDSLKAASEGGYSPVQTSDPEVQAAASFAWAQVAAQDSRVNLDEGTDLEIVSAQQQIVAGKNFQIELSGTFSGSKLTIDVVVYQSLEGDLSLTSYKVSSDSLKAAEVGGYSPVQTSDPEVQAAASFAWGQVAAQDSRVNLDEGTDLEIVSAQQQIVAGKNFQIELSGTFSGSKLTINVVVYQSLEGDLSLTSYKISSDSLKAAEVGGFSPVQTSDPEVQTVASFTWGQVAAQDSRVNLDDATDLEIVSAEVQIVAGKNFQIELSGTFSGSKLTIDALVFQSLEGDLSLTSYEIKGTTESLKVAEVGGYSPVDTSEQDVLDAAKWLWEDLAQIDGSGVDLSIGSNLEIVSAEEQVVAGTNYKLTVTGTFGSQQILVDAVIYKDLQGSYSLTSYETHVANGVIM